MKLLTKKQTRGGENKAFTLIELLGVIIIIGIIALIAVPIVMNIIGKVRKAAFERSVEGIIKSVEINYSMDSFLVPREYFYEKGILTLLTVGGKAREEKIGTHGKIEGNGLIYVDEERTIYIENLCDKSYCANGEVKKIEITPNLDGQIPEINKDYPVITLNGEKIVYVEIGGVYQEEGATAKTIGGKELEYTKEIKYNNEVAEKIETTSEREYTIIYSAENEGKRASVTRTVIVKSVAMNGNDLISKDNLPFLGGGNRYIGEAPNNFVTFNGEAYRIIGIFDGQMKIIYWGNYSAQGTQYLIGEVWDASNSNNWARPATLNTTLNSTYWDSLNLVAQGMVDQNHSWGIGGISSNDTRSNFYSAENNTKWTGKIGLMTVADFGYASSDCTDSLDMNKTSVCSANNWLYISSYDQWTITARSNNSYTVRRVNSNGIVGSPSANSNARGNGVRPVLYLDASVKIKEGAGTESEPYILIK